MQVLVRGCTTAAGHTSKQVHASSSEPRMNLWFDQCFTALLLHSPLLLSHRHRTKDGSRNTECFCLTTVKDNQILVISTRMLLFPWCYPGPAVIRAEAPEVSRSLSSVGHGSMSHVSQSFADASGRLVAEGGNSDGEIHPRSKQKSHL